MRLRFAILAALLGLVQCGFSQAIRGELQSRYRAFNYAIQKHDAKFFDGYLSPTFAAELPNGQTVGRADALKAFNDLMAQAKRPNWTFNLSDLTVVPNGVSVRADGDFNATGVGPDKKKHRLHMTGLTTDTWTLLNNVWMLDHVKFLELHAFIDGKPATIDGLEPAMPGK